MRGLAPASTDRHRGCLQGGFEKTDSSTVLSQSEWAILRLGRALRDRGYHFTTITPASHSFVNARSGPATTLRDIFGWTRPFAPSALSDDLLAALVEADALLKSGDKLKSALRFSTLGEGLFAHSAFPTTQPDSVFFGPDTYRFARAINQAVSGIAPRSGMRILDVGAGSGAGGLQAASLLKRAAPALTLSDINVRALRFSAINSALNGITAEVVESDLYASLAGEFDLIISNPPYLVDALARVYRHGGGEFGGALSVAIVREGVRRLAPGGRLLLYTGSAIVDGVDLLKEQLCGAFCGQAPTLTYEEIDPDVFGEELNHPPYDRADRIAAVLATIDDSGRKS